MVRVTGNYRIISSAGEEYRAFLPLPLPPRNPPLILNDQIRNLHDSACSAVSQLAVAAALVPSVDWFLYGFVRKEAVISSQIEGTQATLRDVLTFEATAKSERPDDVQEVCNYVAALTYARHELARAGGLPLSTRLLCGAHQRLMYGSRGKEKRPGVIRTSQNWIGGTRPGNALYVPPPVDAVLEAMSELDRWIHADDPIPLLIRAGLAHVQFETIHPFLDGNGRIGRLLITLLVEHWKILKTPLLYLSLALKRRRQEYYARLSAVRTNGDWEGWTLFFLECVGEAASDGVRAAQQLFTLISRDRQRVLSFRGTTIPAIRLLDSLPRHPMITLPLAMKLLKTTKPTASKAIAALIQAKILREVTGKQRDRIYAYQDYLRVITSDTE